MGLNLRNPKGKEKFPRSKWYLDLVWAAKEMPMDSSFLLKKMVTNFFNKDFLTAQSFWEHPGG